MYKILLMALLVVSVLLILVVMMQPSKTNSDAMSALSGGATDLFARRKARGFEAVMQRVATVLGVIFFALAIALAYLSSH